MTTKPECTVEWSFDAQHRLDLLAERAADAADALSGAEFQELNDLQGRRTQYLAHRQEVERWKANKEKSEIRPPDRQEGDGVGAKLAELQATRHSKWLSGGVAKPRELRGVQAWLEAQRSEKVSRSG